VQGDEEICVPHPGFSFSSVELAQLRFPFGSSGVEIDATRQDPARALTWIARSPRSGRMTPKQIARWKAGAVHGTRKMTAVDRKLDRTDSNV
jgi:hypothetical protein